MVKRKDNRGISLIEIMVVVAILAVVGSVGVWGLGALSGRPAQQCAQKIIYSLERHRTTSMGKVEAYYTLKADSSGKIVCVEGVRNSGDTVFSETTSEVGTSRVTLSYIAKDGEEPVALVPGGAGITFKFDRGSGAFKELPCTKLIAKSGGREVKIKLVKLTGKVYLDVE